MKALVKASVSEVTNEGKDGTGLLIALHNWGFDVYLKPKEVVTPIHPFIAQLMIKPWQKGYDLTIDYSDDSFVIGHKDDKFDIELPAGYESSIWKHVRRDWHSEGFNFCLMSENDARISLVLDAFKEFRENTDYKTANLNIISKVSIEETDGVSVYSDITWFPRALHSFYSNQHVMLALSEHRNLSAIEFMSTGGLVAAIPSGKNMKWFSNEYCHSLNENSIKETMEHLFKKRSESFRKGELASSVIPQFLDWADVLERLFSKIGKLPNGRYIQERAIYLRAQEAKSRDEEHRNTMP